MKLEIDVDLDAAVRDLRDQTGATVQQILSAIGTEVRRALKVRGAIWQDVTTRGRRGWAVNKRRDHLRVFNRTAHGTINAQAPVIRGRTNPYHGREVRVIEGAWPRIRDAAIARATAARQRAEARAADNG